MIKSEGAVRRGSSLGHWSFDNENVVAVVECKMTSEPLGEGAVTIMMIGMMNVEDTLYFHHR